MNDLQYWQTDSLIEYARNPRKNDQAVDRVAAAIREFGFRVPIVAKSDGTIVDGHLRLKAAKKLGMAEVPILLADDMTEAQIKAFRISVNKMAELAEWDNELLKLEFDDLAELGFDLELTGFDLSEIAALSPEQITEGLTDEDAVPEAPAEPITKEGHVWLLGRHRLMCGDSTNEKQVQKLVSYFDAEIKHCISDPPYGIAYDPKNHKYGMIKNDDVFLDYIALAKKYTNGVFFMWTSYQVVDEWINRVKQEFEKITNMIIWHKGGGGMGDCLRTLATDYEIALVNHRGQEIKSARTGAVWDYQKAQRKEFLEKQKKADLVEVLNNIIDGETVWKIKKDNTSTYMHPTQKPVEVNQRALQTFTSKGDTVIDLFLGSGSNLIACQTLGRDCGGMELDPKYCDVIIKRWQDFTGLDAILEATGEKYSEVANG